MRHPVRWTLHDELRIEAEGMALLPRANSNADLLHIIRSVESLSIGPRDPQWPGAALRELAASLGQGAIEHGYHLGENAVRATGHSLRINAKLRCGHRIEATFVELYEHMDRPTTLEMFDEGLQTQARLIFEGAPRLWRAAGSPNALSLTRHAGRLAELQAKALSLGCLIEEELTVDASCREPRLTGAFRIRELLPDGSFACLEAIAAPGEGHMAQPDWIEHAGAALARMLSALEARELLRACAPARADEGRSRL